LTSVFLWLLGWGGLFYLAALPVDLYQQILLGVIALLLLTGLRTLPKIGLWRVMFLVIAGFLLLRYLFWRTFHTLGFDDPFSFVASLVLYGAELYGIAMFLLSAFVNVRPILHRANRKETGWPTVDIYIPTYNESVGIVKTTMVAATALEYPSHLLNIYLLDDGATSEKRNSYDLTAAQVARRRHQEMRNLCQQLGVHYLARQDNQHAKAGNLNAAFQRTQGDMIVVLDCDHVPTVDFLQHTIPHMMRNQRLFLVQTPHFFITPDPIEKNLGLFNRMPSENDMFYKAVQPGLDFWNASFFCGSAAVLRREALLQNAGFSGQSVTEDAETALSLHAMGWQSRYVLKPLISGLQPETFGNFVNQRMRWAQGMVQLFLLKNPLWQHGLDAGQKLAYLNCMLFWFFPFARLVFLLSPLCFLLFGLKIYDATLNEIGSYTVPYLLALILTANYLFGRVRWFLVSEIYESMQSLFSLRAIINTIRSPSRPEFMVTRKGETLDTDFISPLVVPFYVLLCLLGLGLIAAGIRWELYPEQRPLILITSLWGGFSFLIVIASLGAMYERRQRRHHPRLPADNLSAIFTVDGNEYPVTIVDISTGGAALAGLPTSCVGKAQGLLQLRHPLTGKSCDFFVEAVSQYSSPSGKLTGIRFLPHSLEGYRDIVLLVHGDSRRWERILQLRDQDMGILPALGFLLTSGFRQAGVHASALFKSIINNWKHNEISVYPGPLGDIAGGDVSLAGQSSRTDPATATHSADDKAGIHRTAKSGG